MSKYDSIQAVAYADATLQSLKKFFIKINHDNSHRDKLQHLILISYLGYVS